MVNVWNACTSFLEPLLLLWHIRLGQNRKHKLQFVRWFILQHLFFRRIAYVLPQSSVHTAQVPVEVPHSHLQPDVGTKQVHRQLLELTPKELERLTYLKEPHFFPLSPIDLPRKFLKLGSKKMTSRQNSLQSKKFSVN